MALQSHMPFLRTWVICEAMVKILSLIVVNGDLNQSCGHWFLGNALQFVIYACHDLHVDFFLSNCSW
jgi:hypothetical protein